MLALSSASLSAIINIGLLIHYEVTGGDSGDGFMLPLPLLTWLFLVLPVCLVASIVTFVAFRTKALAARGMKLTRSLVVILIAAWVQPAVFFYTITFHARYP